MLRIVPVDSRDCVPSLRSDYLEAIGGRPEPFLEELMSYASATQVIQTRDQVIGYFCTSSRKTLLQFYIRDAYLPLAHDAFIEMIAQGYIENALVLTRDRVTLSIAMELHKGVVVDCYVFEPGPGRAVIQLDFEHVVFRQATMKDVPVIREVCGDFHDFLHYTLEGSIAAGGIYVLYSGDTLLGTGVIGESFQAPYVDIGMCVSPTHRRRNIGTFIIAELMRECEKRGLVPGASCKYDNIASRRTLEKAGMIAKDRIMSVTF